MKTTTLITLLLGWCVITANAQWRVSATAGPSVTTFGGSDAKDWGGTDSNPKMVLRFHLGVLVSKLINEKMTAQAGLIFSAKGAQYSGPYEYYDFQTFEIREVDVTFTKRLAYIDLPATMQYAVSDKFGLMFGLQPSLLVSAKVANDKAAQNAMDLPSTEDAKDYYNTFDMAILLGPSYALNDRISIQLLYNHGLLKIAKGYQSTNYAVFNRAFKLSLIYVIKE